MTVMGTSAIFQPLIGWLLDLGWDGTVENGVRVYSPENYRMAMLALMAAGIAGVVAAAADPRDRRAGRSPEPRPPNSSRQTGERA